MMNRLAREMAAEIAAHDWSDAPWRIDRAGHQRSQDSNKGDEVLDERETDRVRTNVMWVTLQVLKHADPNIDETEFAVACGVPRYITHNTDGRASWTIHYGLRWADSETETLDRPGGAAE